MQNEFRFKSATFADLILREFQSSYSAPCKPWNGSVDFITVNIKVCKTNLWKKDTTWVVRRSPIHLCVKYMQLAMHNLLPASSYRLLM